MLKRALRRLYHAIGLDGTRLGAFIYRAYKGRLYSIERPDTDGILIAFRITGGIGDHLIAARYIRDLIATVGDCRFDVYSSLPEVAVWILTGMPQFNKCYDEYSQWVTKQLYQIYPLAIHISSFVSLQDEAIKWSELRQFPKLVSICEYIERFRQAHDLNEIIKAHPRLDGLLASRAVFTNLNRNNFAHAMTGISYGGHAFQIPIDHSARRKFGLGDRPYVTIHNGFDDKFQTANGFAVQSTKVYPHFDQVLALLHAHYPDLFIVQLGTKTSNPITGVNMNLIGKTDLAEAAEILAGAVLHIDNESGLVHMAACVGTVSCVLFGPTPATYFGYEDNINIAPRVCGGCWWTTIDWMTDCPRGFDRPTCLEETPPEIVSKAISDFLNGRKNKFKTAKKPLAFLLGISKNLAFAAGNVALSINKYMRDEVYDILVYYTDLAASDIEALQKIPNIRLVQFNLPKSFVQTLLTRTPPESRFRDENHLMCFCHFEIFSLLDHYTNVAWLDADVAVQANLKDIVDFCPFGMSSDAPWTVQNNFTQAVDGYQMEIPGFCSAVMVANDTLPYKELHNWCYEKTIEYADLLITADQAIINLALQNFEIAPKPMPCEKWQCISWKDEANIAYIVHFGTSSKVWNDRNICNAFPEWYRMHLEWLALGGNDFDQTKIDPRNPLSTLREFDRIRHDAQRAEITAVLLQTQGHKVLSGPFSGMVLLDDVAWGDGDIAPKLLGTYEEELHNAIIKTVERNPNIVVNVGCAEGFYSVGLARLLPKAIVFAFDVNPIAQAICRKAAETNDVGSQVVTDGACSIDILRRIITQDGRVLLFIDCEGVELELLNPSLLPELRACDVIVECHDFLNRSITQTLKQRFSNTHQIEDIIEGPRDPNRFPFLRRLQSMGRWLAIDEKRPETMNWLACWSQ